MTAMMVGGGAFGGGGVGVGRGSLSPTGSGTSHHSLRLPSPHSPPSPASSDSPTSPASPGRSGGNKACGVCGDVAKSMHFGGLSCDSCKAFFRRSVQNNAHKGFTCPYEKKCVIAVSSRKACQYCRFHKCLSIGMEKGWVMTEDERRKMMQQRQEKKVKEEQKKHTSASSTEKYSLTEEDRTEISIIVSLYKKAYQDVPYEETSCLQEGPTGVMSPWMTFCKRIGYFFSLFREFADLPSSDQALLLKTAITSACIIMGSVVYDSNTGRWPGKATSRNGFVPNVSSKNVERFVPAELMSRVEHFFRRFQQVCPDETMAMILILVALYSPELMGLEAKDTIQGLQDRYTRILQKYVGWKYKEQASLMFPKVIVSLADIRELAERTSQMRIQQGVASSIPSISSMLPKPESQASSSSVSPMETNEGAGAASTEINLEDVQVKEEEIDLQSDSALQTEAAQKVARLEATGGVRDHTYQKIMQKITDQMHSSSIHMRAPSLLPFIIQIVKKIGAGSSSSNSNLLPSTGQKVGKIQQTKHQRIGSKRRMVEIKQECIDEGCDSRDLPSPITNSNMSPTMHLSPHSHFHLQSEPHLPHAHQSSPSPPQATAGCMYPVSPMESTDSFDMLPPSPLHTSSMRLSPHTVPSPHSSNHSTDVMMSPQLPHMVPVAPYTPPAAVPSPNIHVKQPSMAPVADVPLPSPMAAPSPYSDTSSSSPESSQSPLSELFSEELSNVEIDVLTQLLDYVANIDNLESVSSLKEILPPHLLTELQTKLCSYSLKHE